MLFATECTSYTKKGNQVTFNGKDGSKLSLTMNSNSVIKIWFDKSGKLTRTNPSFAVVNEKLENIGDIGINEESSAYEIFTSKLRIRINKYPMQIQIFDNAEHYHIGASLKDLCKKWFAFSRMDIEPKSRS